MSVSLFFFREINTLYYGIKLKIHGGDVSMVIIGFGLIFVGMVLVVIGSKK